jgi:hypothetical protein
LNRFNFVALCPQRSDEFPRQILVEQYLHAGCGCCCWASSDRTPRTASSVKLG